MIIGVLGASVCSDEQYAFAERVGAALAKAGAAVVCGGLAGTMEAVCKGAKSVSGKTIGILPGTDISEANEFVDVPIATGMGVVRNVIIVRTANVLIALDGAEGTLSETALAMNIGKNVIATRSWKFLKQDNLPTELLHFIDTPEEAVEKAVEMAGKEGSAGKLW
jgi:uncharacterized protein (TIGR00725 family)